MTDIGRSSLSGSVAAPALGLSILLGLGCADDLARIIPSQDMKQILPRLDGVLKACVACHLEYKL